MSDGHLICAHCSSLGMDHWNGRGRAPKRGRCASCGGDWPVHCQVCDGDGCVVCDPGDLFPTPATDGCP